MKKTRRQFIKNSGLLTAASVLQYKSTYASSFKQNQLRQNNNNKDIIIVVFQRGGADGLHSVVPYGDENYFQLRPNLAINNSIDLDGFFGLNPALSSLMPIWEAQDLAIIHATGKTDLSRSHFTSQDQMELAQNNIINGSQGWLANYLARTKMENDSVFRAISMNKAIQKSIKGEVEALTIANLNNFDILTKPQLYDSTILAYKNLYNDSHYSQSSDNLFTAIETIKNINPNDYPVNNGAEYGVDSFARKLKLLGIIIKAQLGVEIACIDIGGWDHHNNINDYFPPLANNFANGLLSFYQDMGDAMQNITIICMTEFGRRVSENGSNGTDHGHASVIYTIGKNVNGGQVFTNWPGLDQESLNRGDLEVSIDYREILSELLIKRLKYNQPINDILPNFINTQDLNIFKF